jgi:hypothetical protein
MGNREPRIGVIFGRATLAAISLLLTRTAPAVGSGIGTDLASLNLCLYGDCEARGTYAADPYGLYNPATLGVATHTYFARGVVVSGSYYALDFGGVQGDVGLGSVTAALSPVAFQVTAAYADAQGPVRRLPGVDLSFRTRAIRLAAAFDAERVLGIEALSLGLAGVVPDTTSDVRLKARGLTFLRSSETRAVELVPGFHWHTGTRDWLMVGGFVDVTRNDVETRGVDLATGMLFRDSGTVNTWFARVGLSVLPFVPLGLADGSSTRAAWLGAVRVGTDVEYRDIAVPGETSLGDAAGYFGADAPLLPDALNPVARWVSVAALAGVDTRGGWGVGAGVYGRGPLAFAACNQAYSSRPLVEFLGDRVTALAVTCSLIVPL